MKTNVHGNVGPARTASLLWSWQVRQGHGGQERDGFLLSFGPQFLGRAKDMSQREVAGDADGRLALDSDSLTFLHRFAFHHR